ncbi:MAG: hypothetical protein ACC608_07085 [Anaerofustis sp.]
MKRNRKESLFPTSLFFTFFIVLLAMTGVHTGLLVLMERLNWNTAIRIFIPILYWSAIAVGLTSFTRWRIQKTYDIPMKRLAEATQQVADGDFSVYVPPLHMTENKDYLDAMIDEYCPVDVVNVPLVESDGFALPESTPTPESCYRTELIVDDAHLCAPRKRFARRQPHLLQYFCQNAYLS